jgi:CubicO group peptidase (beta-lactamase class C family)
MTTTSSAPCGWCRRPSVPVSTPEALAPALERLVAERQADRLPSVAAAVVRKGDLVWSGAAGSASYEDGQEATSDTQYRVGSITKTFTATAIMQLRDAGELDLDDRLEQHLDGVANGTPTLRRMLSHLSGLQREAGDMFVTGHSPTEEDLIASMQHVELVLRPAQAHHYSNLAFALLGQVVARKSGVPYKEYVDERIIRPLGLARTTWQPQAPKAQGYLVDEYARTVWREPETDLGGTASAGQLWSTVGDLCRWATFLARGADGVLDAKTVEEMWFPQVMYFPDDWVLGWGIGLALYNHEGRIWGGHGGAMAGHLAGAYIDRKTQIGAACLTNSGTRGDMDLAAIALAAKTIELWPEPIEAWRPEQEPPDGVRPLLGRWWSEGNEFVFWWEDASLHAKVVGTPPGRGETTFEPDGDGWLAVRGRERGERLRRDGDGLIWAGYAFTRDQQPFEA